MRQRNLVFLRESLCILLLLAAVFSSSVFAQTFVHPGALNSQADFDRIKAKVAAGEWPWYDSYLTLCNDGLSSLGWWWGPVAQITRGGGGGNNFARSQKDAIAIYCLALRYRISGDTRYADKAIEGMDRWSSTMTAGPNGDNWGLAAGLCGYEFAVAGETLRGYPGWSQTSINSYKSFLGLFANSNINFLNIASLSSRSNWLTDNTASLAACGVFCDNTAWFNQAINYYKFGHTNGQAHIWAWFMHPMGIIQMEESGRDQAHVQDALSSMAALCEIADHQGLDLYGYDNNRVLRAAEYFAKFNSWLDVPYTAYYNNGGWTRDHWETNLGYGGRGAFQPVWEMLNAHYYKQGIYAPFTAGYAASHRPSGNVGNWNSPDVLGYDTLTHYQAPPATDVPPSGLMANFSSRQVTLSWFGSPRATSYNVKRSGTKGGPYTTITTTNAMTANYVDDQIPRGQTYYYVVSAMTPSGETANSPEAIGSGCATRYDFEGNASDSVGTFSGTLACSGTNGLPGFTGGHGGGQAIMFNGLNQYVQLPFGALTYQDMTVSAWINWSGGNAWQRIFDTGDTNRNRNMYLTVSDGSRMRFYISDGWHDYDATLYGPVPAQYTWTHVAVTIKAGTVTLYQNGVAVDSKPVGTFPLFGQTYSYIGKSLANDPYFSGAIDDFRIYNGALSGSEIYALGSTSANHAPKFVSDPITLPAAWESASYAGHSIFQKATDVDDGPLVYTKLSGPAWLNVAGNGELSGTPGQGDVGLESFNIRVTDASGASDDATIYIPVNNVNQAPSWNASTITKPSINQNEPYSDTGATLAADAINLDASVGDTLAFSKLSGPAWLSVASNGALTGTPGSADVGVNTFAVRVTDASGLSADATMKITVVPYSLRSQYQFENNLNDSISGYDGDPSGSPTFVPGRIGNAVSLNGSADSLTLPEGVANYREITVAAWVYWNGGNMWQRVFDFGNDTTHYMFLSPFGANGVRFAINNGSGEQGINSGSALASGCWSHVAVTLSGSTATLYVNGVVAGTNTGMTITPRDFSPTRNLVGDSQFGTDPTLNGILDDFRIYNYALSASEITSLVGSVVPLTPTRVTATGGNGYSQITLSWDPAAGATSYTLKRATSLNGTYSSIYSGSATTFTDSTAAAGVTYYYIVTASNGAGASPATSAVAQFVNGSAPRAYLRLDELSGTIASDSSGNGWNGTVMGGSGWAAGKINNAVQLSGTTNYVALPSGVVSGMTACTLSAWVKPNTLSANCRIFDFSTSGTPGANSGAYMYLAPQDGAGKLRFAITTAGYNSEKALSVSTALPAGVWSHVAVVLTGSTGALYVNGTSAATNASLSLSPSSLGTTSNNYLGKSAFSGDPYLNGLIDEFQIYPRALSATEVATLAGSVSVPAGVRIAAGNAQATVTWNPVGGATGYNVKRSGTSGGPYTVVQANVSGTTCMDSGLTNSAGYYYVVSTLNGVAESPNSSEVTTTPVGAPPVPAGLQATGTISSVALTWTPSYGATSYRILRSTTSGTGYALSGTSTAASYSDTAVTNGTTYYYVVAAVGPNGQSANSSQAFAIPLPLPGAPTGLTATGSNASVILSWNATSWATSYNIKRSTTSGSNYSVVATGTTPGFVDTGLTNGTTYYYVVSALDSVGEGANSGEVSAAAVAPPSAPSGYISAGTGRVGLFWGAVSGATRYSVKRSGTSGGAYSVLYTGTATSYSDASVANGTTYYYVITASNAGGDAPGAEMAATPASVPLNTYLRFDEQLGAFAYDSTNHGWNGTLVGGTSWAAGKVNNAVSLGGNSNYVTLPSGLMAGVTDFTVSAWVKLNSTSNNTRIFDVGNGTSSYMELCPKNGSNGFMGYLIVVGGTIQQVNTSYAFPVGAWTHVAMTQSGSTGTLYINGTSVGTNSALTLNPTSLGVTAQNYIGKSQWTSDPYLNGLVDDFRIYGRALSGTELANLANPLAAPASLTATAGYSQVTCAWSPVSGVTSYNLKRSYTSGGPYATIATLSGTTYTDAATASECPYYYVVTSGSGMLESANSPQVTATPLVAVPVISSTTSATGTSGFAFSYQTTATNVPISFGATGLPAGLSMNTSNGIINGIPTVSGTFIVTISATNDAGTGSATLRLIVQAAAPVINSVLAMTGTNGRAFTYAIGTFNRPTGFGATGLPSGLSINTSSGVISGSPSVTGTFAVTISASNALGTGSATLVITLLPAAPGSLVGTSSNNASILSWNASAGASSYKVKRSTASGTGYVVIASGVTGTSYTDYNRPNGVTYYYVVSAVSSYGEGPNSSEVRVIPDANSLVAFLRFDDGAGTTASDSSGHGWNGTLVNGAGWGPGAMAKAVTLTGASSQYVSLPGGVIQGVTNCTLSAWVKLSTVSNWTRIFDFGTGTTTNMFLTPQAGDTGKARFAITTSGGNGEQRINGASAIATGVWTHVAVTISGSTGTLYINGAVSGTNSSMTLNPASLGNTTQNYIGKSQYPDPYLNGSVDHFQIYARALSASEITALATAPAAPGGVTATSGNASANLSWNAVSGATAYNVSRSMTSGSGYTLVAASVSGTSYSDTGLTNGSTYYYVVTTVNGLMESAYSAQVSAVPTANATLPRYSFNSDIGSPGATGTTSLVSGTYTMQGAGADIWGTSDAFQFMYQKVTGDCDVRVRVLSVQNTNAWAKAGVMIRNTLDAGSQFADTFVSASSGVAAQWRSSTNGTCGGAGVSGLAAPYWVRLVRSGSTFTYYDSPDGKTWSTVTSNSIAMNSTVYVGLAVTAHVSGTLCTATMDNFSVVALPSPWTSSDVGTVGSAGSTICTGNIYTMAGSGADISGTSDGFRYAYQPSTGDCDITARVSDLSVPDASAKATVMIRESLNANSIHAMVVVTPAAGISFQTRSSTGSATSTTEGPSITAPCWVRLVRSGSTFTGYYSIDGTTWTSIGSSSITMASSANIGLGVTSHSDGVLCTAAFDNVTVNP
jgi:fibronectin type 3 domain-containing protein/regulation of enolase protein 1 (concanavalin A-like superfamily)